MIVVLFFAVGIAVIVGFQLLMSKAVTGANRKVFKANNARGRAYLDNTLTYELSGTAGVLDAVWRGVRAKESAPAAVVTDTFRLDRTETRARWGHGNRFSTSFVATLRVGAPDGSARATLTFPQMSEVDGVVADVGAMRALQHDVEAALRPFLRASGGD